MWFVWFLQSQLFFLAQHRSVVPSNGEKLCSPRSLKYIKHFNATLYFIQTPLLYTPSLNAEDNFMSWKQSISPPLYPVSKSVCGNGDIEHSRVFAQKKGLRRQYIHIIIVLWTFVWVTISENCKCVYCNVRETHQNLSFWVKQISDAKQLSMMQRCWVFQWTHTSTKLKLQDHMQLWMNVHPRKDDSHSKMFCSKRFLVLTLTSVALNDAWFSYDTRGLGARTDPVPIWNDRSCRSYERHTPPIQTQILVTSATRKIIMTDRRVVLVHNSWQTDSMEKSSSSEVNGR